MRVGMAMAALLVSSALAGCSGADDPVQGTTGPQTSAPLESGKGGILGLLVNDVFRPVPGALIFVEKYGFTTTTDASGQFVFTGLDPGSYVLLAGALNHEASPVPVDVVADKYEEVEIEARRIFNEDGTTITTQYSVFIPCSTSAGRTSATYGGVLCPVDMASEDYRPGLDNLDFSHEPDLTYLVAEIRTNQKDNYLFVLRHDDGTIGGGDRWGRAQLNATNYGKVILQKGAAYQEGMAEWKNENRTKMAALLFYLGQGGDVWSPQTCPPPASVCYGFGQQFAIKANIIITAFIGPPAVDVAAYQVLAPSE